MTLDQISSPNYDLLKKASYSEIVEFILSDFSKLPPQPYTTVDATEKRTKGHPWTRNEIVQAFRTLERAKVGVFIAGRRNHPSRFRWAVDSSGLIAKIRNHTTSAKPESALSEVSEIVREIPFAQPEGQPQPELITYRLKIRPGVEILMIIPDDMTTSEADRIARFVSVLPMQGA